MPQKIKFKLFLILFGLLGLLITITRINPQEVLAQVTSGSYFIGDISIDEGGGKRTSGAYTLTNTSIGQPFAGAYYVGNNLVVGGGHAYKLDPYPTITINNLRVGLGSGGTDGASTALGSSGLRSDEGGLSFFNALSVSPEVSISPGTPSQINLVGAAFTEDIQTITSFEDLTASAHQNDGFVLLYANTSTTKNYYDKTKSALRVKTFDPRTYNAFINGAWVVLPTDGSRLPLKDSAGTKIADLYVDGTSIPPLRPKFAIDFYKSLGDKTWETYAVVSSVLPDIIQQKNPIR